MMKMYVTCPRCLYWYRDMRVGTYYDCLRSRVRKMHMQLREWQVDLAIFSTGLGAVHDCISVLTFLLLHNNTLLLSVA